MQGGMTPRQGTGSPRCTDACTADTCGRHRHGSGSSSPGQSAPSPTHWPQHQLSEIVDGAGKMRETVKTVGWTNFTGDLDFDLYWFGWVLYLLNLAPWKLVDLCSVLCLGTAGTTIFIALNLRHNSKIKIFRKLWGEMACQWTAHVWKQPAMRGS